MRKGLWLIFFFVVGHGHVWSQQLPHFSQYRLAKAAINPAFIGYTNGLDLVLLHRSQWGGIEGAPQSQLFLSQTPLMGNSAGVGLTWISDVVGPSSQHGLNASFAYRVRFKEGLLGAGISMGFMQRKLDASEISYQQQEATPIEGQIAQRTLYTDIGISYNAKDFYAGISSSGLGNGEWLLDKRKASPLLNMATHLSLIAGKSFQLSEKYEVNVATVLRNVKERSLIDVGATVVFDRLALLGLSLRGKEMLSIIGQYYFKNKWRIGYSYDITLSQLSQVSNGTHELLFGMMIDIFKYKMQSARNF